MQFYSARATVIDQERIHRIELNHYLIEDILTYLAKLANEVSIKEILIYAERG